MLSLLFVVVFVEAHAGSPVPIAHRGFSANYPENTMVALNAAFAIDGVAAECDLRVTADSVVILLHDQTVDRTTNGTGVAVDLPWSFIETLDAGSWKAPQFSSARVPKLADALAALAGAPSAPSLILDCKSIEHSLLPLVADVLALHTPELQARLWLGCWDTNCLTTASSVLPGVPRLWIAGVPPSTKSFDEYRKLGVSVFSIGLTFGFIGLTREFVTQANAAGFGVYCWTLNSKSDVQKVASWGAAGLIGDNPQDIKDWTATGAVLNVTAVSGRDPIEWEVELVVEACLGWAATGRALPNYPSPAEELFETTPACRLLAACEQKNRLPGATVASVETLRNSCATFVHSLTDAAF